MIRVELMTEWHNTLLDLFLSMLTSPSAAYLVDIGLR